jgi:hypothetical protein
MVDARQPLTPGWEVDDLEVEEYVASWSPGRD